jgi:phosphate uptake regulator
MVDVEIRKVQRLGASSLIVTLPHSWAKRVNLKPGDSVMIAVEGVSLKLTPISKNLSSKPVIVDMTGLRDPRVRSLVIPCFYILGYDEVDIKLSERSAETLSSLKSASSRLTGLEIVDLGGDIVTAKILLDPAKVDLRVSIRSMTILTSNIVKAVARVVREGLSEDIESEVRSLGEELYKLRSIIERQIHIYPQTTYREEGVNSILALTALTLLSLMDALLIDIVEIARHGFKTSRELSQILDNLGGVVPLIGSAVVNPSIRRSLEILDSLQHIQGRVVELVKSGALDGVQYVIATRIMDFVKILQVICYAITCVGLSTGEHS